MIPPARRSADRDPEQQRRLLEEAATGLLLGIPVGPDGTSSNPGRAAARHRWQSVDEYRRTHRRGGRYARRVPLPATVGDRRAAAPDAVAGAADLLRRILSVLRPCERAAVVAAVRGMGPAEQARVGDAVSAAAARVALHKARRKVRALLGGRDGAGSS